MWFPLKMSNAEQPDYILHVSAGPAYDPKTHQEVNVNAETPLIIETEHATLDLRVRIRDYKGSPSSISSSSYFSHPLHEHDQYSIGISFTPKRNIAGTDLIFGNDFERPIRDRLPPGTNKALKIVKWAIDPGLEVDAYADKPYLYGPALSSWNYLRICGRAGERPSSSGSGSGSGTINGDGKSNVDQQSTKGRRRSSGSSRRSTPSRTSGTNNFYEGVVEEGAEGSGLEIRQNLGVPEDPAQRRKFFLDKVNRDIFTFEEGRVYKADFGNPYLGFSDFTLRLPGFSLQVTKYIDEKTHELRYVLKNKETGDVYFVLIFTLLLKSAEQEESEVD